MKNSMQGELSEHELLKSNMEDIAGQITLGILYVGIMCDHRRETCSLITNSR